MKFVYHNILLQTMLLIILAGSIAAQTNDPSFCVVEAVAPIYPARAVFTLQEGATSAEVVVGADGKVIAVRQIQAPVHLRPVITVAALKWRFSVSEDDAAERIVRLTFVFSLVPPITGNEEMMPIYRPPYEVEVRARTPVDTKNARR